MSVKSMKKILITIFAFAALLGCQSGLAPDPLVIDGDYYTVRNQSSVSTGFLSVFALCHDSLSYAAAEVEAEGMCLNMDDFRSVPFVPNWSSYDRRNPVFKRLKGVCHKQFGYTQVEFFACD